MLFRLLGALLFELELVDWPASKISRFEILTNGRHREVK